MGRILDGVGRPVNAAPPAAALAMSCPLRYTGREYRHPLQGADQDGATMCIEYRLSLRDVVFFQLYQYNHSPSSQKTRRRAIYGGAAVIIALTGAMAIIAGAWSLAIVGVVFALVYAYLFPQLLQNNIRRMTTRLYAGRLNVLNRRELEIRPEGLTARSDGEESTVAWKDVRGVTVLDRYLLIYLSAEAVHIVPRDTVLEGDFGEFAREVQQRIPKAAA